MSVEINYITMFGVRLTWNVKHMPPINGICFTEKNKKVDSFIDIHADKYTDIQNNPNIDVIVDGFSGKWVYIGKILFDSRDEESEFVEIDLNKLHTIENQVRNEFVKEFPEYVDLIDVDFKLFAFVHYL